MTKSSKLYKDSPSIKKDGDGKPGISKPTPADGENMGVEGAPLDGGGEKMPVEVQQRGNMQDRHQTEMKDMHKRHEDEVKDMHKRHLKEVKKTSDDKPAAEESL